jgi:hypothetical protein
LGHSVQKGAACIAYACTEETIQNGDCCGPNCPGELRGKPTKVKPSSKALEPKIAQQLNDITKAARIDIASSLEKAMGEHLKSFILRN